MDAVTAALICLRRWYVFLPVLLVAITLAFSAAGDSTATYTAEGQLVVLPDASGLAGRTDAPPDTVSANPYARVGGARLLAAVLKNNLVGAQTRQAITQAGGLPGYTAVVDPDYPIITVSAVGSTPRQAQRTVDRVVRAADPLTRQLQEDVSAPTSELYAATRSTPTTIVAVASASGVKVAITYIILGLAVAGVLAVLTDVVLAQMSRRARRGVGQVGGSRAPGVVTRGHPPEQPQKAYARGAADR